MESPSTTQSGPDSVRTRSLCSCQWLANAAQSPRMATTPSVHRPNQPPRSPDRSATGVLVTYEAMLATISTGDRRTASPRPGNAFIQAGRETSGIRCMRAPRPGHPGVC